MKDPNRNISQKNKEAKIRTLKKAAASLGQKAANRIPFFIAIPDLVLPEHLQTSNGSM